MIVKAIVAVTLIGLVSSSAVPLTKCNADDSKCIKQNTKVLIPLFAAGIPELGMEPLDPVVFKKIDASNDLLTLVFKDLTVTGLKSCRFKKIELKKAKQVLSATIHCDVVLDGNYHMNGNFLLIPVKGDGKAHIEHEKIEINFEVNYKEETGADGKKHWIVGAWSHSYAYLGKNFMDFDNLFDGNDILAAASKALIKDSPKELAEFVAPPVVKIIVSRILKNVKIFFDKVPVEEFSLD